MLEGKFQNFRVDNAVGFEITSTVSLPDMVLDLLCDVAKDAVGAAWAQLYVFEGNHAVLLASSSGSDMTLSKRLPIGLFLSPESAPLEDASGFRIPKQLSEGAYHSTKILGDNAVIGQLIVGFGRAPFDISIIHKNMLRSIAQVVTSRLRREVAICKAIRDLLGVIETGKQ